MYRGIEGFSWKPFHKSSDCGGRSPKETLASEGNYGLKPGNSVVRINSSSAFHNVGDK